MGGSLPGEGYAYAAGKVIDVVQGGLKPGQKAQDALSDIENKFVKSVLSIVDDPTLRAINKEKIISNVWEGLQAQIAQTSSVDKNFAKAATGALANLNTFMAERFRDLAPHIAIERTPGYIDPATGQLMNAAASSGGPDFAPFTTAVSDFSMAVEKFSAKAIPAATAGEIPSLALGELLKKSGLVMAHAGEVVMPLNQIRAKMDAARSGDGSEDLAGTISKMFGKPQESNAAVAAEIKSSMGAAIAAILGKSEESAPAMAPAPSVTVGPGGIVFHLHGVNNLDQFLHELELDKGGLATKITRRVFGLKGAIVTR